MKNEIVGYKLHLRRPDGSTFWHRACRRHEKRVLDAGVPPEIAESILLGSSVVVVDMFGSLHLDSGMVEVTAVLGCEPVYASEINLSSRVKIEYRKAIGLDRYDWYVRYHFGDESGYIEQRCASEQEAIDLALRWGETEGGQDDE